MIFANISKDQSIFMNLNLWSLLSNCREAEDEKKQRAEIERRRKEEEALVAKYLEAERIKADEVSESDSFGIWQAETWP